MKTEVKDISNFAKTNNLVTLKVGFKKESLHLIYPFMSNLIYHTAFQLKNLEFQGTRQKKKAYINI